MFGLIRRATHCLPTLISSIKQGRGTVPAVWVLSRWRRVLWWPRNIVCFPIKEADENTIKVYKCQYAKLSRWRRALIGNRVGTASFTSLLFVIFHRKRVTGRMLEDIPDAGQKNTGGTPWLSLTSLDRLKLIFISRCWKFRREGSHLKTGSGHDRLHTNSTSFNCLINYNGDFLESLEALMATGACVLIYTSGSL